MTLMCKTAQHLVIMWYHRYQRTHWCVRLLSIWWLCGTTGDGTDVWDCSAHRDYVVPQGMTLMCETAQHLVIMWYHRGWHWCVRLLSTHGLYSTTGDDTDVWDCSAHTDCIVPQGMTLMCETAQHLVIMWYHRGWHWCLRLLSIWWLYGTTGDDTDV